MVFYEYGGFKGFLERWGGEIKICDLKPKLGGAVRKIKGL